jgi:hypothetical protein
MDATLASAAAAVEVVMASTLLAVAARSWARTRASRMAWLAAAFAAFLAQALFLAWALLFSIAAVGAAAAWGAALAAAGLLCIYLGLLRP